MIDGPSQNAAGITGHQDLIGTEWIKESLDRLIAEEKVEIGITSLARGADQLFADCLLGSGRGFRVVVPCRRYHEAFSDAESRENYERLLAKALDVETLDFNAPSEQAFLAAGRRIVDLASMMIAVWDGRPAKGLGGTADIVKYARSHGGKVYHINPMEHATSWLS